MSFFKLLETRYSETDEKFFSKKERSESSSESEENEGEDIEHGKDQQDQEVVCSRKTAKSGDRDTEDIPLNSLSWWAAHIPDFFIMFFFTSLLITSCFLDLILSIFLFFEAHVFLWVLFLVASYFRVIFELKMDLIPDVTFIPRKTLPAILLKTLSTILGMHSIVISLIIIKEALKNPNRPNKLPNCTTYPVFKISNENLSVIKIFCFLHLGVRCIPQLFIMSVFIGLNHPRWTLVYLSTANILLNMVLFSFTMSITLPIRDTPRVFVSLLCAAFSAFNKFLATLCGCCASMIVFMAMFRKVEFYALFAQFSKITVWLVPCHMLLSKKYLPKLHFVIYLIFFPVIYSFVFIHPFEKTWVLYYYFFYLLIALLDLALLGLWTEADLLDISCYSILRFLQVGFISLFGLLNGIKKGKSCELKVYIIQNNDEIAEEDESGASSSRKPKEARNERGKSENV